MEPTAGRSSRPATPTRPSSATERKTRMTPTPEGLPKLGITLFSLTLEMRRHNYSLESMIRRVSELDLGPGLEIVGFQSIRDWPRITDEFVVAFRNLLDECELVPTA